MLLTELALLFTELERLHYWPLKEYLLYRTVTTVCNGLDVWFSDGTYLYFYN
jgi:hypothetical protein